MSLIPASTGLILKIYHEIYAEIKDVDAASRLAAAVLLHKGMDDIVVSIDNVDTR